MKLRMLNVEYKILKQNFRQKRSLTNSSLKPRGSALLIGIFLSGLMLTVGVTAARLAVREVQFSADLFLGEKAYTSAESGVERALLKLKTEPLAHLEPTNAGPTGDVNAQVSIRNLINTTTGDFPLESFAFELPPLASQKWRLRKDIDPGEATTPSDITSPLKVDLNSSGKWFWRFLCQDTAGRTQALQGEANNNGVLDLLTQTGRTDEGLATTFNAWSGINKDTCYVSVQNTTAGNDDCSVSPNACRTFTFSGTVMAPHAAHIHAIGQHQDREKHIRFDYAQKSLGSLFDFSFLHSESGL